MATRYAAWARPLAFEQWEEVSCEIDGAILVMKPVPETGDALHIDLRGLHALDVVQTNEASGQVVVELHAGDQDLALAAPTEAVRAIRATVAGLSPPTPAAAQGWYPAGDGTEAWWDGSRWGARRGITDVDQLAALDQARQLALAIPQGAGHLGSKRGLEEHNEALRGAILRLGVADLERLGQSILDAERRLASLQQRVAAEYQAQRSAAEYELSGLLAQVTGARARVEAEVAAERARLAEQVTSERLMVAELQRQVAAFRAQTHEASRLLVAVREEAILQEVGIYNYRHRLEESVDFKAKLSALQEQIKGMAKRDGGAISARTDWTVNGSTAEGRKMVSELSRLMLRAYNAEADRLAQTMRPYKLDAAIDRLNKSRETISRLGKTMSVVVTLEYHQLRVKELELTADYLAKVEEEKDAQREEKQRLREEAAARKEYEAEKARLRKEQLHYQNALAQLRANGDAAEIERAEAKLSEIGDAISGVEMREANHRVGHVYVISNIGSFGAGVVKIGMTRRLDPLDRVRELGDASVPFRYDVHAIVFSEDAVGLESALHRELSDRRVNLVNHRREFFYATPSEVELVLRRFEGSLLSFVEVAEAEEWHQSQNHRRGVGSS